MDRIQVCYLHPDTETAAPIADGLESLSDISLSAVDSQTAARQRLADQSVDCLLAEWIDSAVDRKPVVDACRRDGVAVVWIADEPTTVDICLEAGVTEYISKADIASGSLLAHRIRSAVAAAHSRRCADDPSTDELAGYDQPVDEPLNRDQPVDEPLNRDQSVDEPLKHDQLADELTDNEQPPTEQTSHEQSTDSSASTAASTCEIVEQSQAGILVFDSQGLITRLNPAAEEILQLSAAEAIGNNCETLDMRSPTDEPVPQAERPVARVLHTGEPIRDTVVSIPDGTGGRRWLSISASPLANGKTVDGVVVTLEDISTAVELESTLETVLDRMTDGFVAFDTDLRLTYASKRAIDTDRYPASEYLGLRLSDLGDHLAQYEADLQEVLDTQESKTVETYIPEPTDEWIRARLYPSETGISVFFREVTDEKQRERELQQYKTIVESVRDGVCILDRDFEFVFVNEAFCELVGYDEAELLGQNAALVTDQADMEAAHDHRERLFSGTSKAGILSGEITSKSGQRVPSETWMTPITLVDGEMGTVGVVRDLSYRKDTEAMFTALYNGAHELLSARSDQAIAEIATETAVSVLDFEASIFIRYDDKQNVFRPLAYTPSAADRLPELLPIAAESTSIVGQAYFESELVATEDLSELPGAYDPDTAYRRALFIPLDEYGVLFVGDTEPGSTDDQTLTVAELLGTTVAAAVDRLASEQQSQAHRRTLAEQTEKLDALTHTNALVEAFGDRLFSAQSRQEVEAVVCSVLAGSEPYRFVWIGAAESRGEAVATRASDGHDNGYLDWLGQQLSESADGESTSSATEPTARAVATNTPVAVDRIADHWQAEPWRKEALSRGFQSAFSIPLRHNDISYGVVSVYAETPNAFDEATKRVLTEFGQIIAYVITTTEMKQGLLADHRTELELEIVDSNDILHRLAKQLDTPLRFEGVVPQHDSHSLLFFSVDDIAHKAVEAAAELHSVESLRVVTEQNGTILYEASVSGDMLAATLVDCGATPTTIETDGERLRAVVTLPQSTSVRTVTERLKSEYPSTTVISRQNRDHSPQTRETFQMQLQKSLTDRQAETLRTAYFARYFDSPRASTGTEVGNSLGISQPTFNYHLRAALRTLLTLLFEDPETLDG